MDKIKVVLAEDHPITREGIKRFLSRAPDIEVVGEFDDGEQAVNALDSLDPDVLLLDMELPGLKGPEVAQKLRSGGSKVRILALSTYDNKQFIFGMLASGASGYLTKEEVPERIVEAVRGVARGEQGWVSRRVAAIMATWTRGDNTQGSELTNREVDVLRLVVDGKTNQEIGYALGISQKTVEKHLESIFGKLHVASRVEAAVLAVKEGLV
jgi:two-component system NarL family response regulator